MISVATSSPAECDRRCQGDRSKDDEERRRRKLHRYPRLRQGCEDRVDDDRIPADASQGVAARGAPHDTGEEVGKEGREDEDEDRRYDACYDAWDVGYEPGEDLRDLPYAKSVGGRGDGDDEDEPENELAQDGSRGLAGSGPLEGSFDAPALHPIVETYRLEDSR